MSTCSGARCHHGVERLYFSKVAKQSLLSESHGADGAVFVEQDGWRLPKHFGDPAREYEAVRAAVGLIDFSHRGLLQFTGPDRLSFLQGMLSNDLRILKPFDGQPAALLTQQGKVVADLRVLCAMNSFYLDFWESLKEKILAHFNRYLIADEVEIADRSDEYGMLSIQGPRAATLLRDMVGSAELPGQPVGHTMVNIDGSAICVINADHTGETGFDLIIPSADMVTVARRLTEAGEKLSAAWIGAEALNILRVEAGIPRYGIDFNEDNLLLEVGLDRAVSFTKGCYLGQEVVERIRSRGHVNKKLLGLLIEGETAPRAGSVIEGAGKTIGAVTSSVISPRRNQPIALAYLHKDFWTPGAEVCVHNSGRKDRATVVPLPFVHSS
jgi:folate-binding protein YgfZ